MPVVGQVVGNKYRLERLVGSGGFASVWAARNVMLDRVVALKILSESYARMPGFLPRFLREAKLASRAIHKTIVAVEDIDQTPDGLVYLVMELLEGHTLADELKGARALALERTLEIMMPTLEGLAAAHALNIIHRDIKPANIFLTREGTPGPRVRILDLGLAKDLLNDEELTSTDQMVGTPSYLAPEMFMGPQTRRWAPAADVFACGMLMFRMLAGGLPFDRSVANLTPIEQFLARAEFYQSVGQMPGPAQYVPAVPPAVDAVVRRSIALSLRERYADAGQMLDALREAAAGLLAGPRPARLAVPAREPESTIEEDEDASNEIDPDADSAVVDEGLTEGKTRVDAGPFASEASASARLEGSLAATPAHLQPVSGRTVAPTPAPLPEAPRLVPRTLPPSSDRVAGPAILPQPFAPTPGPVGPGPAPTPVTLPPARRRRSPLKIVGAALGVIAMLVGLAFGTLWVTWTLGCWGRNRVDRPAAAAPGEPAGPASSAR